MHFFIYICIFFINFYVFFNNLLVEGGGSNQPTRQADVDGREFGWGWAAGVDLVTPPKQVAPLIDKFNTHITR